ncbi:MAG: hypothetical protein A2589_02865 [Candidatus Vogelbacteria bacterium RIFOXYD1_FULL_46_19]|uniref:Metallo-beta-lactamase domain-containing protein n=1 Tax=Candidatus Vogelbacteria bacterium RIFOXYD1_FULL_46_19 TaxID=1802439 RepID=A0A1G2QI33_9BACT|nr:MAG: hypothetical protein A2589_02865 [Candidatus Vogelbacteria bacterium RIFOXYD1_FULL_46_19]
MSLRWFGLFLIAVLSLVVWLEVVRQTPGGDLSVSFLDVGQGDAIFIEAPNGNQILIDGGFGRQVLRELGGVMPFYDRSLDLVIATHSDTDHLGGLPFVLERFAVSSVMTNGEPGDNEASVSFAEAVRAEKVPELTARAGVKVELDRGVELTILYPDRKTDLDVDSNTMSIVALLRYGETEFLLTGDAPAAVEDQLVQTYTANLRAEVLKLGHHGSDTSSSDYFLAATKPDLAIISAGRDNRYGHPHQVVLDRLDRLSIPYFSTADVGTITFQSDGYTVTCVECSR